MDELVVWKVACELTLLYLRWETGPKMQTQRCIVKLRDHFIIMCTKTEQHPHIHDEALGQLAHANCSTGSVL